MTNHHPNRSQKRAAIARAGAELAHDMRMLSLAFPCSCIPEIIREAAEEKFLRTLTCLKEAFLFYT